MREEIQGEAVRTMYHLHSQGVEVVSMRKLANTLADGSDALHAETIISEMAHDDESPLTTAVGGDAVQFAEDPEEISGWILTYIKERE